MKFVENTHMNKAKSHKMAVSRCPFCEYENRCNHYSADESEKVCMDLSSETQIFWIQISEPKPSAIQPPMRIDNVLVLQEHHKDRKSNKYYLCMVELQKGVYDYKVMRGDNLVRRMRKKSICGD